MKKRTFFAGLVGLASGMVLAQNWKILTKEGIKFGIRAGLKVREISQQAMEDLEDLTAEAAQELSQRDGEGQRHAEHDQEVM
jgi:hypothetical protein